jgi:hypothetical protein
MMRTPRPFPVLPIDDDRESDGEEADENDHMLANRPPDRGRSHDRKGSSRKSSTLSPLFALGGPVLASLLGPKSATPTIEECEVRLAQIGSEIRNAQIMFDDTTNGEVRSACRQRISRLADERRFHQIVHERHRIQTMWETTMVESVRVACQERLRQLISELESLRAMGGGDAGARDASDNGPDRDLTDVGDMDGEWYDRVLEYVGGAEATQDKMPRMSSEGRANCHLDGGRRHERSTRQDFLSTPQQQGQHGHRGEVSYRESDYVQRGMGDEGVSHEHLSPPPFSPPRRGGGRVIRHPVAYAVKSRTSCIG